LLFRQIAQCHADVIRPEHNAKNGLPERQMEKPNGEQPAGKPGKHGKTVLFHFYFFHIFLIKFIFFQFLI